MVQAVVLDDAEFDNVAIGAFDPDLEKLLNKRDNGIHHTDCAQFLESECVILKNLSNGRKVR